MLIINFFFKFVKNDADVIFPIRIMKCHSFVYLNLQKVLNNLFLMFLQHISEERLYELLGLVDENSVNQWINKNGWKTNESGNILISNQVRFIIIEQKPIYFEHRQVLRFFYILLTLNCNSIHFHLC